MGRREEAVEAAGFVDEGAGTELEQAIRRCETPTYRPAYVSLRQRALLDRSDGGKVSGSWWCVILRPDHSRASPSAALQHFGSEPATVQLDFHGRRIFPDRSSGGDERPWITQSAARGGVSGDGAGGDRASMAGAAGIISVGAAPCRMGAADRGE